MRPSQRTRRFQRAVASNHHPIAVHHNRLLLAEPLETGLNRFQVPSAVLTHVRRISRKIADGRPLNCHTIRCGLCHCWCPPAHAFATPSFTTRAPEASTRLRLPCPALDII